ncbi:hypothetical protein IL306_015185 [Fusarium sp. DS 682]|nr:hypothetical protein IL306_015185 [Fusarium sp. DS 682]
MQMNMEMTEYVIPMMAFERSLVMEVQTYLADNCEAIITRKSNVQAFNIWKWSQAIQRWLRGCLDAEDDQLRLEAGGSRSRAYEGCFAGLENGDHRGKHHARITQIRERNPNFVDNLGDKSSGLIKAVPDPDDNGYWQTLNSIVEAFGRPWDTPYELDSNIGRFDIFSLIRIYFLRSLFPLNTTVISETFTAHDAFLRYYTVNPLDDADHGDQFSAEDANLKPHVG